MTTQGLLQTTVVGSYSIPSWLLASSTSVQLSKKFFNT